MRAALPLLLLSAGFFLGCGDMSTSKLSRYYATGPAATTPSSPPPASPNPSSATPPASAPVVTTITVSPASPNVLTGKTQQFTAAAKDQTGNAVPDATFSWSVSGGGTISSTGLFTAGNTAGGPYIVTATSGAVSGTANVSVNASTVVIGEQNVLNNDDSGNADLLLAQEATLTQAATIQSLTFYVAQAAGMVRFGVYDATGPNGGPGAKKAETAETAAQQGWMTVAVVTPVLLPAGTYWLAYAPSDNGLHFVNSAGAGGKLVYYSQPYGEMPATFSTAPNAIDDHWSFYATLTQ